MHARAAHPAARLVEQSDYDAARDLFADVRKPLDSYLPKSLKVASEHKERGGQGTEGGGADGGRRLSWRRIWGGDAVLVAVVRTAVGAARGAALAVC